MSAAPSAGPFIEARFKGRLGDFQLDAALSLPAQGISAVVGPSGCGKTSLLRCIAGLTRLPGRLQMGDEVWQDERLFRAPHRRLIGYVFQEPSLLAHLSVRGNLLFGLRRTKARPEIAFDDAVSLLGLGALLDRSPARLSGGERQRVAVGRALLSQPKLLLMDEPVSSLDAQSKAEVLSCLERLHRASLAPVIYVSHDLSEIARLADLVVFMKDGRVTDSPKVVAAEDPSLMDGARRAVRESDSDRVLGLAVAALMHGLAPVKPGDGGS